MAVHSEESIRYLLSLEGTVLLNIDPYLIKEEDGAIIVSCSDGRCFPDIFAFHGNMQQTCRENPLIHPLPRHGGALVLAPNSPLVREGSTLQDDLYSEIVEAMTWIKIRKIVASGHYPCGKASDRNVGAKEAMSLLFGAKRAMRQKLAQYNPHISSYFHVDYGSNFRRYGKKKQILSYLASRVGWEKLYPTA